MKKFIFKKVMQKKLRFFFTVFNCFSSHHHPASQMKDPLFSVKFSSQRIILEKKNGMQWPFSMTLFFGFQDLHLYLINKGLITSKRLEI